MLFLKPSSALHSTQPFFLTSLAFLFWMTAPFIRVLVDLTVATVLLFGLAPTVQRMEWLQ